MKNEGEIPDVFKYMYFIYDNLNIDEKDNEKDILDKFIYNFWLIFSINGRILSRNKFINKIQQ